MCGIVGTWSPGRNLAADVAKACLTLHHRGPDDSGAWQDERNGVCFGHARLSVLDLSPAGHQPMVSACGRYVIVFNGEIYNHLELRKQLKLLPQLHDSPTRGGGVLKWRGHSDTETLLACFVEWGVEKTLRAAVGMFSLALWDREARKLFLARDRLGEKPLYFGYVGGAFAFASELKALRVLPGFTAEVDRVALALFTRHNAVPAPYSIYRDVAKLPPGTWLEVSSAAIKERDMPRPSNYWSALEIALDGNRTPLAFASDSLAVDALEEVLSQAVAGEMVADVPLGAFLSGGIDSSTVVALMQSQSSQAVRTFSIGFHDSGYDEAQQAKSVARHLGTDHTELYVTPRDALAVIPKLPTIYDEPFADSSQIPTYLVAAMTKRQVTVALSGDGGDELFGGYERYSWASGLWNRLSLIPSPLRTIAGQVIQAIPVSAWDTLSTLFRPYVRHKGTLLLGDKLHKAAVLLDSSDGPALYRQLVSHWSSESLVLGTNDPATILDQPWPRLSSLTAQMMAMDAVTYLPDDILVKVDRAAMAVGLETRVPLLDHRVFEFAWRLPMHYKVRGKVGKWILRQVLYRHVPRKLVDRPKMGFGVPIAAWLRGPLREWAEGLLCESRLRREGYFNPAPIRLKWREHLSGQRNWQDDLWGVLMFQAWLESRSP